MSRKAIAIVSLFAPIFGLILTAHADNNVHIPGTACSPRKSDVGKTQYNTVRIQNESTSSSATVACPVHYEDDANHGPTNFFVRVVDRNSSSDVSCTLRIFDEFSTTVLFQSTVRSSGNSTAVQDLDDGSGDGIELDPFAGFAMMSMDCTLPLDPGSSHRSAVVNYQLGQVCTGVCP
jgi:hypothetical protein